MKKLIFSLFLIGTIASGFAQTPKDGAAISLNEYNITLKIGEEVQVPVQILRSKRMQKSELGTLVAQQKTGLETTIVRDADNRDLYLLTLKAIDLRGGTYPVILKIEGKNSHRVKQSMLMLSVEDNEVVASNNK